jgi:OmpA-OmpF porin, OOP family
MLSKSFCHLLAATLFAVFVTSNVFAASTAAKKTTEPTSSFSVTPTVGGYLFAPQQHLDPALLFGMKVSYDILGSNIINSLGLEGTVNYFSTKSQGNKADGYLFRGDARYLITPRDKVVPFLAVGLGDLVVQNQFNNHSSSSLLFNYGAGFQYFLEEWLALRVDARQIFIYSNVNTRNNFELSTGITYVFGKEHKKKAEPVKLPAVAIPAIPDVGDQEPGAPPEIRSLPFYEKLGVTGPAMGVATAPPAFPAQAPPPVPVPTPQAFLQAAAPPEASRPAAVAPQPPAAPPAPAAPAVPKPATTKAEPPPAVQKPADLEAEPPPAPKPAAEAAEPVPAQTTEPQPQQPEPARPQPAPQQDQNLQMEISFVEIPAPPGKSATQHRRKMLRRFTVEFDFGSYQIRPVYDKQIGLLAAAIKASPESTVIIEAHTDFVGRKGANVALSINRAKSLREELVKQGVDRSMISIKGYGYSRPVADNRTEKGRQKNRRAVAVVTIVTIVPDEAPAPK